MNTNRNNIYEGVIVPMVTPFNSNGKINKDDATKMAILNKLRKSMMPSMMKVQQFMTELS